MLPTLSIFAKKRPATEDFISGKISTQTNLINTAFYMQNGERERERNSPHSIAQKNLSFDLTEKAIVAEATDTARI